MAWELLPCSERGRESLANNLINDENHITDKMALWVASTFPSILPDIARHLVEQAVKSAKNSDDPAEKTKFQLKPFYMFAFLLGRSPQISGLMYSYFENSSFSPLPDNLFKLDNYRGVQHVVYLHEGFDDSKTIKILLAYYKYISFNPKWFSAVWSWSELGRLMTIHTNPDIRYLATCCLSAITNPTRVQHISLVREVIPDYKTLIDLQVKYRHMNNNSFRPCIETDEHKAISSLKNLGESCTGASYPYCGDCFAKVANILLVKRDIALNDESRKRYLQQCQKTINKFVVVDTIKDTISQIAYSISINRPCILRGSIGAGKTALLDYIAAMTNRVSPPDYVKIQIGDQLDSKLLIGSYVCTELPGQFEWQPGPLTKAMAHGSWIVFEDIDSAPSEMAQVIHSVIENGNLSCVSSCPIKLESPHPEFRILFTQRIQRNNLSNSLKLGSGFIERLCNIVDVPEVTEDDLKHIINKRYEFGPELTKIIYQLYTTSRNAVEQCDLHRAVRAITMRDIFKFCERIKFSGIKAKSKTIGANEVNILLLDATDCFLASLPQENLINASKELGALLNKPENAVKALLTSRKPAIKSESDSFNIGRIKLMCYPSDANLEGRSTLAYTQKTLQLMESISKAIASREPVLLVGETGVGKTSIVQHIADSIKAELIVINLSQQSDSSDLLGGFKPVEMREIMRPYYQNFYDLFKSTYNEMENRSFLQQVESDFVRAKSSQQWRQFLELVKHLCARALKNSIPKDLLKKWKSLQLKTTRLSSRLASEKDTSPMALTFSSGSLLRAVKEGKWILLDEVNLAEPEVLQCLVLLMDSIDGSRVYMNIPGDNEGFIEIHKNFRIFACMNPATDLGKRDLTSGIRGRFTEFYVDDIKGKHDLRLIVESYVKTCLTPEQIENVVNFYLEVRDRSNVLSDISGNAPVFSLRTLCRALKVCAANVCGNMEKSLFESLRITFLQQLNEVSVGSVMNLMKTIIFGKDVFERLQKVPVPKPKSSARFENIQGFWVLGAEDPLEDPGYIITKSVKKNLQSLSRIISLSQRKLPILIQGKTSVGKTSLIMHLATITGNKCYRINNHEHTDLQDYFGRYALKENGELVFKKGLLVKAMERGHWLILDELNLAPSELLEALNRVLDDNRELYIPETRETIKASSKFVLFATQNPPEEYAGRKMLSRAFRNRFVELHFDEIPSDELEEILEKRCEMPQSYAKIIVSVMKDLQIARRESGVLTGKYGFMTLRDLFRWGERYKIYKSSAPSTGFDWYRYLASEGLILLEARVRTKVEADTVKRVIEKAFKSKKGHDFYLDRDEIYQHPTLNVKAMSRLPSQFKHIHLSREFRRMFVQLLKALEYNEPVLLCGQTGCGKTTACQIYAILSDRKLLTYNCHLNTESSDFIGSVRPSREVFADRQSKQTFPWVNGPLIEAMQTGSVFLMDEISLADDAVLERLNSVLEPSRTITLTEKDGETYVANKCFRVVATMNPGGDYGKKELSLALRNRFTEIYCHNVTDVREIMAIVENDLATHLLKPSIAPKLMSVMKEFLESRSESGVPMSIRDILSWTKFLNKTTSKNQPRPLSMQEALKNGASLVYFDQYGTSGCQELVTLTNPSRKRKQLALLNGYISKEFGKDPVYADGQDDLTASLGKFVFFRKFHLTKGQVEIPADVYSEFVTHAPTVQTNLMKIFRAMQLDRPILLEGDPGAGKTSVISALARITGHELVRINLSEQTDISDLFGSDLPDSSDTSSDGPKFRWHDGPILSAIKNSRWVLLDEMNLASQSVLEGLNACFDHRGEIYIPEINKRFSVNRGATRFFACQNPYSQGAARKGLPQSFLNRFTSIYIESHSDDDLEKIITKMYPQLAKKTVTNMVLFNKMVHKLLQHSGFEYNLRDMLHWCDLTTHHVNDQNCKDTSVDLYQPERFVQFVYIDRLRNTSDQSDIMALFESIFKKPVYEPPYREVKLGDRSMIIGRSILPRNKRMHKLLPQVCVLKYQLPFMESVAKALERNKMPILVGEPGVGKRSIIRVLASLTGNELNIVGANEDMDTVELLGSFEQKSLQREIIDLIDESREFVTSLINSIAIRNEQLEWSQIFRHIWTTLYSSSMRAMDVSKRALAESFRTHLSQMRELINRLTPLATGSTVDDTFKSLTNKIERVIQIFLFDSDSMYSIGNFEWIDSILVKSIRKGEWLMIENANLLNPATLDRLNSLVETNGTLSLNEKGSDQNGIEVIKPHPNFRLILTMSPQHGELSRAMRNRGIEIFVQPTFYFEDFLMLLYQNGFEPKPECPCMSYCLMESCLAAHNKITGEIASEHESGNILALFALNCVPSLTHQIRRGSEINTILSELLVAHYSRRGYAGSCSIETLLPFIRETMAANAHHIVDLNDVRYNWINLIHDIVNLSIGDASTVMISRENHLLVEHTALETYLRKISPDEILDHIDIVKTCISIKILLELSTHGDFEHRIEFLRENYHANEPLMKAIEENAETLYQENIRQLAGRLPRSSLIPSSEIPVDTRNTPDIHKYLAAYDYRSAMTREPIQNKWILSTYRLMLSMEVKWIEERTKSVPECTSLCSIAQDFLDKRILREDLIKPVAEIAVDIYDLLDGLLLTVSNRQMDTGKLINKTMSRFFWLHYLCCKLRRGGYKDQLIALCNQLPMLWALTYQKVLVPLIKDFELADLQHLSPRRRESKKFSLRIKNICDFFDTNVSKPSKIEKEYHAKVFNSFAQTIRLSSNIGREVDKLFSALLHKYAGVSDAQTDNIVASCFIWSSCNFLSALYQIENKLLEGEKEDSVPTVTAMTRPYAEANDLLKLKNNDFGLHWEKYHHSSKDEQGYPIKLQSMGRRHNGIDQYAPVWQHALIQQFAELIHPSLVNPGGCSKFFDDTLANIRGLIVSPRYYAAIKKVINRLIEREEDPDFIEELTEQKLSRENLDIYSYFLLEHLIHNIVFDHYIVGWTKTRISNTDLDTQAPIMPEYSPIISLVASYCLDASHLKLNSFQPHGLQINDLLSYLWRKYSIIKLNRTNQDYDLGLAKRLIHLRSQFSITELIGTHTCHGPDENCECVETYIARRSPSFAELCANIRAKLKGNDMAYISKAIRLVYFGYMNYLEYAPIFTLDPSIANREKLEVYRAELAHVKLELDCKNLLYYWKTGENFDQNLAEEPEAQDQYPFSMRLLVERRIQLEKKIAKLKFEHCNRPMTDDGSHYYELKKDVESYIQRFSAGIQLIMNELITFINTKSEIKYGSKFANLISNCRMLIKNLERSILKLRSEYPLYTDMTTSFLVGLSFVQQGLRCMYSRFELRLQIANLGFKDQTSEEFARDIMRVFSHSNMTQGNLESVCKKLNFYSKLEKLCPTDRIQTIQSILLKTVVIQLNHHILITPSDIQRCIPIVRNIADLFHSAWLKRKLEIEEERKKHEETYRYKVVRNSIGEEISYEQQEYIDICSKFPLYDHIYKEHLPIDILSKAARENLATEEKIAKLNHHVDLSMCIEICKAHYKFMTEASRNLLGQFDSSRAGQLPKLDMQQLVELESEVLYTIIRQCIPNFDLDFDATSLECHILQALNLKKMLTSPVEIQEDPGSLKNSLEILDEKYLDIHHDACTSEVLKFQTYVQKLEKRIATIQEKVTFDGLTKILKLTTRMSSFLITDPLMKFITGSHTLLSLIEEWNGELGKGLMEPKVGSIDRRLIVEQHELMDLIKSWRDIETKSWKSSLHRVKQKYTHNSLCDLWFGLYKAFGNPINQVQEFLWRDIDQDDEDLRTEFKLTPDKDHLIYPVFATHIKEYLEDATLGDFQIRLDLVFAYAIQTRFASLYNQESQGKDRKHDKADSNELKIDYEKLSTYVYNVHRQYQSIFTTLKEVLRKEEAALSQELKTEIRLVNWSGKKLWDIKNNFRISHRKLNKVMNKYLEVLKRPIVDVGGLDPAIDVKKDAINVTESLASTLLEIHTKISQVVCCRSKHHDNHLGSLNNVDRVCEKFKELQGSIFNQISERYTNQLESIEQANSSNLDAIRNFYSHRVQDVIFNPKDTKETKAEKQKLCRQMYHSKKFALQSVFKNLQIIGVSHQRGKNSVNLIERQILSLEPLRGMIQSQSISVLDAATSLVRDDLIAACNDLYRDTITSFTTLGSNIEGGDLTSDQVDRISGIGLDFIRSVNTHTKDAALVYRDFITIQAALTRLEQLQNQVRSGPISLYNFNNVHVVVIKFNDIVGRAMLSLSKLEQMCDCFESISASRSNRDAMTEPPADDAGRESQQIRVMVDQIDEANALITQNQYNHISSHLLESRKIICRISDSLRDMLNHSRRNYLYSDDDIQSLLALYNEFTSALTTVLPQGLVDACQVNCQPETLLGSFIKLLDEAKIRIRPKLNREAHNEESSQLSKLPNKHKLDIRLYKLVKATKLAAQEIFQEESTHNEKSLRSMSEAEKRRMKPFNHIDSSKIRKMLKARSVVEYIETCFMTLNNGPRCSDIGPLVADLTPLVSIYQHEVASYLNIILASIQIKLDTASRVFSFFQDLRQNGFGMPYKVTEENSQDGAKSATKDSEDNAGFGEGQGDTDVSKKLEFESQLDELKKDDKSKEDGGDDHEQVAAHDDGVEMSEDIDAEAKGADETQDPEAEEDQDEGEDNEQELDKEMDKVDEDEGQLDEKLWDDKNDPFLDEEDDKEDLRETAGESLDGASRDEKELQAKDDKLQESISSDERGEQAAQEDFDGPLEERKEPNEDGDDEIEVDQDNEEATNDQDKLDLEKEANLAKQQQDVDMVGGEEEQQIDDESVDMDQQELGPDDLETNDKEISDGEIDGTPSDDSIDNNDIDDKLEDAVGDKSLTEDEKRDPVTQELSELLASANPENGQEAKGFRIGMHQAPIDLADESQLPNEDPEDETTQSQTEPSEGLPSARSGRSEMDAGGDVSMDEDSEAKEDKEPSEQPEGNSSGKRTLAKRDEQQEDQAETLKRQKILGAADDDKIKTEVEETPAKETSQIKPSQQVRHVQQATGTEHEVIDLCSSDDECLDTEPQADKVGETRLEPKLFKQAPQPAPIEPRRDTGDRIEDLESISSLEEDMINHSADTTLPKLTIIEEGDLPDSIESTCPKLASLDEATTFNTNYGLLRHLNARHDDEDGSKKLLEMDEFMSKATARDTNLSREECNLLLDIWEDCTKSIESLVHELNHKLQIVLQPTKMSKYKGDYKTGKRLNMRKIVSYIASQYRKDKIWLRRTRPSKRTYNICLAVDNSRSMSENNCRLMTYQSLALLARSLSLIEAGSLSVVTFGEEIKCIHEFGNSYDNEVGARWLRDLRFSESKTYYGKVLKYACHSFDKQIQSNPASQQGASVNQLLIILSDGRNVTSEAADVQLSLRQLKSQNVLTLFIIIDNLNGNGSIMDIQKVVGTGPNIRTVSYMEQFPFPFYVVLRQLDAMPAVLGEALRQWFELVNGAV